MPGFTMFLAERSGIWVPPPKSEKMYRSGPLYDSSPTWVFLAFWGGLKSRFLKISSKKCPKTTFFPYYTRYGYETLNEVPKSP